MKTVHCGCELDESWALWMWMWILLWMWILWGLSITNVNFMRADHCKCKSYTSWALWICFFMYFGAELSLRNVISMGAELWNENLIKAGLGKANKIFWELSFVIGNLWELSIFVCDLYQGWASHMYINWAGHCTCII